jgi:hypothetical protein
MTHYLKGDLSMNVLTIFLTAMFLWSAAVPARAQDHNSKLVEGAKKEGKLIVYTSMNQAGRDAPGAGIQ